MITIDNQPVLLDDPGGVFARWVEANISLDALTPWSTPLQPAAGPQPFQSPGYPLPRINWPKPPKPKINSLWWPTGATRFSVGLFLMDDESYQKVASGTMHTLLMKDETTSIEIELNLFRLATRRLTIMDDPVWLLILVDGRYSWQWDDASALFLDPDQQVPKSTGPTTGWDGSWPSLIRIAGYPTSCSASNYDTPDSAYLAPDFLALNQGYISAPLLMDMTAWSCGLRVVVDWTYADGNGNFRCDLQNTDTAGSKLSENQEIDPTCLLAGGMADSNDGCGVVLPDKIRVTFRDYRGRHLEHTISWIDPGNGAINYGGSTHALVHSSGFAKETGTYYTKAHDLATQIATDWWAWRAYAYDMTYSGLYRWIPTGMDDWVWWQFGSRNADGSYACCTRIASLPPDVQCQMMFHQIGPPLEDLVRFQTDVDSSKTDDEWQYREVSPVSFDGDSYTDQANAAITLTNNDKLFGVVGGQNGIARFRRDTLMWEVLQSPSWHLGKIVSSGHVALYSYSSGNASWSATGQEVIALRAPYFSSSNTPVAGQWVRVEWYPTFGCWMITAAECES